MSRNDDPQRGLGTGLVVSGSNDTSNKGRRTKSAPVFRSHSSRRYPRGRSPADRSNAFSKEESVMRSSRMIFDASAVQAEDRRKSETTSKPVKKRGIEESTIIRAVPVPDPRSSCSSWLRYWSTDRAVTWAMDYFAKREWQLRDFVFPSYHGEEGEVCLGEGGDGCVTFAVEAKQMIPCVLKELYSDGDREVIIHAALEHPRIVRFYADFYDEASDARYVVLEFLAGGTLFDALPEEGGVSDDEAAYIIQQLAEILKYLHSIGVVYADLKTSNVLLAATGTIKLADFGASHYAAGSRKLRNITGTVDTQPPEMHGNVGFDKLVDNWSLGVLTYRLLVGDYPFSYDDTDESIRENILRLAYEIPESVSTDAASLIQGLLKLDPAQRLSLNQVLSHPWLKSRRSVKSTVPAFLAQRAQLELASYASSLAFNNLRVSQHTTSVLSLATEYLNVPLSPASFILCLLFTFAFGMVTAFHIQSLYRIY